MAEASAFNLSDGLMASRELMICYANTGTSAAPVWEPMGYGVEDSSIEFNFDDESRTDILGNTTTTIGKPQLRQSFEPCEVREGSALQLKIYNALRYGRYTELAAMDMLIVHKYVGSAGSFEAERYPASAVVPQSLGGSKNLELPFDVVYGGAKALGTAAIATDGTVTFTPAV